MLLTCLTMANLVFTILFSIMNIYCAIWLWSLQKQFGHQNLTEDQKYALAMFSFLIIGLLTTPVFVALAITKQSEKDERATSRLTLLSFPIDCFKYLLGFVGIIAGIVFLVRAFIWLPRFHAAGELHNLTMDIVYIVSQLIPFGLAALLLALACFGAVTATIIGVTDTRSLAA